jgi:hypothetical protein
MNDGEQRSQFNLRLPERALRDIAKAGLMEGKSTAEYLRIAGLAAACHTFREVPATVFVAPSEQMTLVRAQALGMTPVTDVGAQWEGEVRVRIGKSGSFQDQAGGVWTLTVEGLKQVMGFDPTEEAKRLAILLKAKSLESRSPYEVLRAFTAYLVQSEEDYAPTEQAIRPGSVLFADPDYWKGRPRDGQEIIQFFCAMTRFYVDRQTFLGSTRRTSIAD